jgi:hypothetical protein
LKIHAGVQADVEDDQGKAKLVILASKHPRLRKSEIEDYTMVAKSAAHHESGNDTDWAYHVENTTEYTHWLGGWVVSGNTDTTRRIPEQTGESRQCKFFL